MLKCRSTFGKWLCGKGFTLVRGCQVKFDILWVDFISLVTKVLKKVNYICWLLTYMFHELSTLKLIYNKIRTLKHHPVQIRHRDPSLPMSSLSFDCVVTWRLFHGAGIWHGKPRKKNGLNAFRRGFPHGSQEETLCTGTRKAGTYRSYCYFNWMVIIIYREDSRTGGGGFAPSSCFPSDPTTCSIRSILLICRCHCCSCWYNSAEEKKRSTQNKLPEIKVERSPADADGCSGWVARC